MDAVAARSESVALPPVTVLSGFLGAGKTTMLRHVLSQAEGRRWAAVVNDVAALNIDAAVVESGEGGSAVVRLQNGCVCCSHRDDLGETLLRLAAEGSWDHVWVETTGVAEPRALAQLFVQRNAFGRSVGDGVRLANLVTVVDVGVLADALAAMREGRRSATSDSKVHAGPRPLVELMLEQVECADVVVLNQCDRTSGEALAAVRAAVAGLNPRAEVIETEFGQVPSEVLTGRERFDAVRTLGGAAWIRALNAVAPGGESERPSVGWVRRPEETRHEQRFGLTSFVFQARRAFQREALRTYLDGGVPGLVRVKGFIWLAEQPDEMVFLSMAGGISRWDTLHAWGAALVEAGRVRIDALPPGVRAAWEEPHGDRRQELVFIGVRLDETAMRSALEACLG